MAELKTTKWMSGYYRVSGTTLFAGIKKVGRTWEVEIRFSDTGVLMGYAGIWDTLKDAKDEATEYLGRND